MSKILAEKEELKALLEDEKACCEELKRKLANMEANYESAIRQRDQAQHELELVCASKEQGQKEIVVDDQTYFEKMVQETTDPTQPERTEPEEEGTEEEQVPDELEERSETHSEEEEEVKRQEERRKRDLRKEIERCKAWKAELEVAIARIPDRKLEEKSWGMPHMKCIFCWQWDSHYSQACMRYPTATERRRIVRARHVTTRQSYNTSPW
ncbi:hypothetical protein Q1695_009416 [Nippostrongylus brasiliensis]|nr:hypothetical protein Q1695_009416 [Nippostrongylus brasiliensis]